MPRRGLDDDRAALLAELRDLVSRSSEIPVATTSELADRVDRDRRRIHEDLEKLELLEHAASLQAGARARVWWPTPHPWRDHGADHGAAGGPTGGPVVDVSDDVQEDSADVQDVVDDLRGDLRMDLPTRGKDMAEIEAMLEALVAVAEYIRTNGEVGASELQDVVYDDHSGPYGSPVSWYKKCIKPGLAVLAADGRLPITAPPGAGRPWGWGKREQS